MTQSQRWIGLVVLTAALLAFPLRASAQSATVPNDAFTLDNTTNLQLHLNGPTLTLPELSEPRGKVGPAAVFASKWVPLGPNLIKNGQGWDPSHIIDARNHVTGRVSVVTANPLNPVRDVWVGAASGGLWHGVPPNIPFNPIFPYQFLFDWQPMLDSLSPLSIGAIKLASCNSTRCSTVWVGTGENSIRRDTYYGSGVVVGRWNTSTLKYDFTTGLGSTLFANGAITGLAVDPTTSFPNETVYVALSSGEVAGAADATIRTAPAGDYGIYKSTDSGQSWTPVLTQSGMKATNLEMDPNDPLTLYAGMQSGGFFKSTDGGATWSAMNSGIDAALLTGGQYAADWAELAIAPSQTSTLYAALAQCPHPAAFGGITSFCQPAIYQSIDSGNNWQLQSAFVPASSLIPSDYDQPLSAYSMYEHKLVVHPTDPTLVYFTGMMLSYSNSSGQSWITVGKLHPDHHDLFLFFDASSNLLAYDANDGGLFAGDGFDQWDDGAQYGLQITQLQSLATVPGVPGMLLMGTQDNGTNANFGLAWKHVDDGDSASAFVDVDDAATAYDVYVKFVGSPRRCKNNLQCNFRWPEISSGLVQSGPIPWYPPMVQGGILPSQTKHALFVASNRLYTSSNQGSSWTPVGSLLPSENTIVYPDINSQNVLSATAIAPSNAQHGYVGYYNGEVWASTDMTSGSGTWMQKRTGGSTADPVSTIAVDPADDLTVFVGYTGPTLGSIWVSPDGGGSWSNFSAGLGPTHVNSLAILLDGAGRYVIAGTDNGVLVRGPGDAGFHPLSSGLPAVPVYALALDSDNGKLYAGTHGRGVWALDFNQSPLVLPILEYCLSCNFFGPDPVEGPVILTLYGEMFPANQPSCTVRLFQPLGQCAVGTTDGDGATIGTDDQGRLVTSKVGLYIGKPLAWGCLAGRCVGDTGQSRCMSAPVTQASVTCGEMTKTFSVPFPSRQNDPPSAFFTIAPDMDASNPPYTLTLNARVRSASGAVQTLCSVSGTFAPGSTTDQILSTLGDAIAADPTCNRQGVIANVTTGGGAGDEEEDPVPNRSALSLSAPMVIGRQLFPEVRGNTFGVLQVDGLGRPLEAQLDAPMLKFEVPVGAGAAGGSLTITESTSLGRCSYTVPTFQGDTAARIAGRAAAMFNSASNDGNCRDLQKPRDVAIANPTDNAANAIFAAADQVSVQNSDINVMVTVGPSGW